jgi:hypothetical protein
MNSPEVLAPHRLRSHASRWLATGLTLACALSAGNPWARASDHADPIDPLNFEQLEGGITDLFVFPVDKNEQPVGTFKREAGVPLANTLKDVVRNPLSEDDKKKIDALVFILCVRRQLTQTGTLHLEPYTYRILVDTDSKVSFPTQADVEREEHPQSDHKYEGQPGYNNGHDHDHPGDSNASLAVGYNAKGGSKQKRPTLVEAFARYGGSIAKPSDINEEIVMEFKLNNTAKLKEGYPKFSGAASANFNGNKNIKYESGVYDDPFIFPAFFGTNVVAMAVKIPMTLFPANRTDFLIWATSHKGNRQVDHVGRSLRTQNPRFELLNTLPPSQHAAAILEEHENPSLVRDLALRLNFAQTFAYRKWDFVPDVMCYSTQYPVGFPNGRLLTDDVAALLAQHGDTLLYELSYQHNNGTWPRQATNDKNQGIFHTKFPYLLEPHPDKEPPAPPALTTATRVKLFGIALLLISLLVLENWIVARLYYRRQLRRRYL